MKPLVRSVLPVIGLVALIVFPGCGGQTAVAPADGGADSDFLQVALPEIPAADFLIQVLTRYRNAQSYRDRGEVWLRVEKDGRLTRRVAPMHVVMDGSTFWLAAYDARLWSDHVKTLGWIADDQSGFHDSQVVVGASARTDRSSSRPQLSYLLRDPILTSRMVSGLGGPPPQLEWLLDPNPMAKLFGRGDQADASDDDVRLIEYEGVVRRDSVPCVVVRAVAGNDTYRFFIDRTRSLIQCVQLPVSMAGQQVELDGWKVHSLELVLVDASFASPASPYELSDMPKSELPPRPKYLRSLVPLPPPPPDRRLGQQLAAFDGVDVTGRVRVTKRGVDRPLTLWLLGYPSSADDAEVRNMQSVNILSSWLNQLPESVRSQVRPLVLVDRNGAGLLQDAGVNRSEWFTFVERNEMTAQHFAVEPGQAILVDSTGRIIWLGQPFSVADLASLAAVASDAIAGVDVCSQIQRQWQADRDAYRQKLDELMIR